MPSSIWIRTARSGLKGWQPDQLCTLLRAGINVYAPVGALYLPGDPQFAAMQQACLAGGSTLVGGGSIPGLVSDVLPLFLTGYIGRVDRIRAAQSNLVWDYQSADRLSAGLGLGAALSAAPTRMPSAVDRKWIRYITQSAAMIADAIGLDFGGLELTSKDYAPAPHDLQLPSGLSIAAGTAAGVRWIFTGYSAAGDQFYTLTKEQVAVCGLGPTWRQSGDAPQWRVEIDGCPSLVCDLSTVSRDGFGQATADLNAARAVNLVASIVAAAPGCRSVRDFAAPTGTALGRRLSG